MEGLLLFAVLLLGVLSSGHDWILGSEMTVRPGDNVTLYCDCKLDSGESIVWHRNCSHEDQPSLVLRVKQGYLNNPLDRLKPLPRFHFVENQSSYDLLIVNVTDSDEGLYYCGSEHMKVKENKRITDRYVYKHCNIITKIKTASSEPHHYPQAVLSHPHNCDMCWKLLFSLCPLFAGLSSLLSFLLGFYLCDKNVKQLQQNPDSRHQTRENQSQDEDVCYAALEIRQASQRLQTSDFCTYSATVHTART